MEVAESNEQATVGPATGAEASMTNGERNRFLDGMDDTDDGRSSSLSEIDDVSDNEPSDFDESPKPERQMENDSEAETERLEDSPHNVRKRDIVISAGSAGPSPSKLHQSTTLDDVDEEDEEVEDDEDDEEEDEEEPLADDSPSKRRPSQNNGIIDEGTDLLDEVELPDSITKKRKRLDAGDETGTEIGDDEPVKKRRSSIKSDLSDAADDGTPLSPEPIMDDPTAIIDEGLPVDDLPESDLPAVTTKGKKPKKGKRKGKRNAEVDEEPEVGGELIVEDTVDENLGEDDETAERVEGPDNAETAAKAEEESARKMLAMDSLATLEKQFATLRDKIYDERISKLNRELDSLRGPNPTHPEYVRQIECVQRYRDAKIQYEHTLYHYRIKALVNKSLAERAQSLSTFFQKIRDVREVHSSAISQQFYAIQHDRFKTDELSPHHIIPFPTRRSQQIAHQTAYNQEVSVMAGVAKYVGFPAAPTLLGARPSELDDDLEKMGIAVEPRFTAPRQSSSALQPRAAMSSMPSNMYTAAEAEEAFLERTPWANPQHPIHQQQTQHQYPQAHRPQPRPFEAPSTSSFATPAAQKRVVDVHAPNGSASTIPESASAANSSANNTPYGTEQDPRHPHQGTWRNPDYDAERKSGFQSGFHSGFRSQSSSPLDVRKSQAHPSHNLEHRSPTAVSSARNPLFSPPPARSSLFHHPTGSKPEASPLPSKPVDAVHYRPQQSEVSTGPGPGGSHMPTR